MRVRSYWRTPGAPADTQGAPARPWALLCIPYGETNGATVRGERSGDPVCARAALGSAVYPLRGKCSARLLADGGEQYNHRRHVLTRRLLDSRQKAQSRDRRQA